MEYFISVPEYDQSGSLLATYVQTRVDAGLEGRDAKTGTDTHPSWRVDIIRPQNAARKAVWEEILAAFLPAGYPSSVTDDYLP